MNTLLLITWILLFALAVFTSLYVVLIIRIDRKRQREDERRGEERWSRVMEQIQNGKKIKVQVSEEESKDILKHTLYMI